ncbi:hypothetical protein LA080_003404 [Diaporthe eres]|nr:hypothetical protein LA080_003404 [Diaporthe eres]
MTSTPTHLPQPSVGAGPPGKDGTKVLDVGAVRDPGQLYPPGRDSVPAVTENGVRLDGSALPGADEVWIDRVLELADGDGTPDDSRLVGDQESRVLPGGLVDPGGKGLLGGGAPDGVPVGPLETAPEGEVVPGPDAPLEAGLDASNELLGPPPADVTELEAGGIVALLSGSELIELATEEPVASDEVSKKEAEAVFDVLDAPVESPGSVDVPDDGGDEGPGRPADGDGALSDKLSEDVGAATELEGPSLSPLDAELVGRLEVAVFGAELGGSVREMLRLSLLLGLGTPSDSEGVEAPVDGADSVPPVDVGKPGVAVPELGLPDEVIDAAVLSPVLGTVLRLGEVDKVSVMEDGDKVLLSRLVGLVSTAELAILLADPEGSEDMPPDVGLEVEDESGAETSVGVDEEGPALEDEAPDTIALETGPLADEDSVYGPPVEDISAEDGLALGAVPVIDILDTGGDELIVQVSTLVVVRSVIWEVDKFVAIVVTTLVVIVAGRLGARLAVLELSTGSGELGPEDEGSAELGFKDESDAELARVEGVGSDDDACAGGTSEPGAVDGLDVAADDGPLDNAVPEDGAAEVEAPFELWQVLSASSYVKGLAFTLT